MTEPGAGFVREYTINFALLPLQAPRRPVGFLPPWNLPLHCWRGGLLSKAISSWTCLRWDMGPETHRQLFFKRKRNFYSWH